MLKFFGSFKVSTTLHCCGMLECGEMHFYDNAEGNYTPDSHPSYIFRDTKEECAEGILTRLRAIDSTTKRKCRRPILFNFKKHPAWSEFDAQELLDRISKEEDFTKIAEYTNPNTGNTIYSCMLLNGAGVLEPKK